MTLTATILRTVESPPKTDDTALQMDDPAFLAASPAEQAEALHASSLQVYLDELHHPWDVYFGEPVAPLLAGAGHVLDLGCFTGGRVVAWAERYGLRRVSGIDIDPLYTRAAEAFCDYKRVPVGAFPTGYAEELPFPDSEFDAIVSFDVMEHVRSPALVLAECYRVLKPGGVLCVVFPSYFQPAEHHLTHVTRAPFLHWFIPGRSLVRGYHEVIAGRGGDWYNRPSPELEPWERGHTLNGLTERPFKRLVASTGFRLVSESDAPFGSTGRRAKTDWRARAASRVFSVGVKVPFLRDFSLHRIAVVLEKPRPARLRRRSDVDATTGSLAPGA